jgi:tetratricopeptide (TPR) repeat protein
VLYEMLGGEPPHTGPTPQAILARQLTGEVRSLTPLRSTVSSELDAVIKRALAPAPADRYATAYEFKRALLAPHSVTTPAPAEVAGPSMSRSARRMVAALAALAAVVALGVLGLGRLRPGAVLGDGRVGIAVFPLRASGEEAERWSEQLPDLLATALDGTPGVRVADPWSLWRNLRPDRAARAVSPADAEDAERLATAARADRFVLGSLAANEGALDLNIRMYRAGIADPLHSLVVSGSADSIASLVQRLAVEIITRVWPRDSAPSVPRLDRYATRSADALKAYLHAKEAMRRGGLDEAEAAIDTALALDSTFALALVEAVTIKSWAATMRGDFFFFMPLAERASMYSDSLSERNRLRVEAMLASVRTDGPTAAASTGRILQIDSTDVDAWQKLVYYHMVYGWQYGADETDAVAAANRALQLDSTHVPTLVARARYAIGHESKDVADRYVALLRAVDTTNVLVRGALLAHRAMASSDDAFTGFVDTLAAHSPGEWRAALMELRQARPERFEIVLDRLAQERGPGIPVDAVLHEQARLSVSQGRLTEVYDALRSGTYAEGFEAFRVKSLLVAATLAGTGDEAMANDLVASMELYTPPDSALEYFDTRPVWLSGWLISAYHATFGDSLKAREWQEIFGTLPAGGTSEDYRAALQADVDARLSARKGDYQRALRSAKRAYDLWTIHTENTVESSAEPAMRLHYGMLLRATGQADSAASILRSVVPPTTWLGFLTARSSFELGQINENRGDLETAARHYARALSMWERGDSEIQGWRNQARDGLQRVVGERPR